jgi:hypothetical protein
VGLKCPPAKGFITMYKIKMKETGYGVKKGHIEATEFKKNKIYKIDDDLYKTFKGVDIIIDIVDTDIEKKFELEKAVIKPKDLNLKRGRKNAKRS